MTVYSGQGADIVMQSSEFQGILDTDDAEQYLGRGSFHPRNCQKSPSGIANLS
jgi:hypothetical protein